MKANRVTLENAYKSVTGVTKAQLQEKKHRDAISNALEAVWLNKGLFAGETPELQDKRLDIKSAADGEASGLAQYFKELYPDDFIGQSAWIVIFKMYTRMNGAEPMHKETETTTVGEVTEVAQEHVASDKLENNNIREEKETEIMSKETQANLDALNEVEGKTSTGNAGPTIVGGALPGAADIKATMSVSKETLKKNQADRETFTKNTVVEEIVLSKPAAVEVAVAKEKATGAIKDTAKVFEDFCKKTGCSIDSASGQPEFKNVPVDQLDNAKTMFDQIKEAVADPERTFPVYFSKSGGTIKGYKYSEGTGSAGKYVKPADIINVIINSSVGMLKSSNADVQLIVRKAKPAKQKGNKGAGTAKTTDKSAFGGIANIGISNKKTALDSSLITYHKELIKSTQDAKPGMKTEIAVKYYRGEADPETGERKTGTYRIPLNVMQYGLEVVDEAKKALGDGTTGVGAQLSPINIDDPEVVKSMLADLSEIAAQAAAKGAEGALFEIIRNGAEAVATKDAQDQVNDMGETDL